MISVLLLAQTTLSYTNLALQLMVGDANYYAEKLKLKETLPIQVTNLTRSVVKDRRSEVSGQICTSNYVYEFFNGQLEFLSQNDVSDGEQSPPNTFREREAVENSRHALEALSFDTNYLNEKFRRKFCASSYRGIDPFKTFNPGFQIWKGLPIARFAFELRDEKMESEEQFHAIDFYYHERSKELIGMQFARGYGTFEHIISHHPPLVITNATDIVAPLYFSGEATSEVYLSQIATNEVKSLVSRAHAQMRQRLGTNKAVFYFVCDNLNAPDLVAKEAKNLLSDAPWIGTSDPWHDDLPFSQEEMDRLGKGKRGIAIFAIAGPFTFEVHTVPAVDYQPLTRNSSTNYSEDSEKEFRAAQAKQEQYLKTEATKLSSQFHFSETNRNVMWLLLGNSRSAIEWRYAFSDLIYRRATLANDSELLYSQGRSIYIDGKRFIDVFAAAGLSGDFPYFKSFKDMPNQVDGKTTKAMQHRFRKFQSHPLQDITAVFTPHAIEIMRNADRVETIRVKQDWDQKDPNAKTIEGYPIIGFGPEQANVFARALTQTVVNERYDFDFASYTKACIFQPGVIFQFHRGEEMVRLTICFNCEDMSMKAYDAERKEFATAWLDFRRNRPELVKLCKEAFPHDAIIQGLKEKED